MEENNNYNQPQSYNESKTGMGVLLGIFGLIGLIVGILIYPEGTIARKTFIKGWIWTFVICIIIAIIAVIIYFSIVNSMMNDYLNDLNNMF